jgi:hypothetical protein
MALIEQIKHVALQSQAAHKNVECTFDVVTNAKGTKFLQLDTYGSKERKIPGKKSQSLRFSPAAVAELKVIIRDFGL